MTICQQIRERLDLATVHGMFLSDEERLHLDREVDAVFESIRRERTIESAESKLHELGVMQEVLATICFGYKIDLSEKQRRLVREYDRWDVFEVRAAAFEAIKKGEWLGSV